jgi:hypothetical protein
MIYFIHHILQQKYYIEGSRVSEACLKTNAPTLLELDP